MPESSPPCVLVVADPGRVAELTDALREPLPQGEIAVVTSTGGDDTIELFEAKRARVVVLTASLEVGDPKSLIEVLRGMVPRDEVVMVVVGDDEHGPVRNALDAIDLKPDRFVTRPLTAKAVRFAVGSGLDTVARARGELAPATSDGSGSLRVHVLEEAERLEAVAEAVADAAAVAEVIREPADTYVGEAAAASDTNAVSDRNAASDGNGAAHVTGESHDTGAAYDPGEPHVVPARTTTPLRGSAPTSASLESGSLVVQPDLAADDSPFARAGTAPRFSSPVETDEVPTVMPRPGSRTTPPPMGEGRPSPLPRASTEKGTGIAMVLPATPDNLALDQQARRAALRARWEALADSIGGDEEDADDDLVGDDITEERPEPLPPVEVPRKKGSTNPEFTPVPPVAPWRPGTTSQLRDELEVAAPPREPTLIIHDDVPARVTPPPEAAPAMPIPFAMATRPTQQTQQTQQGHASAHVDDTVTHDGEREPTERWSHPVLLSELIDRSRDSSRELLAHVGGGEELAGLDALGSGGDDDEVIVGHPVHTPPPHVLRGGELEPIPDLGDADPAPASEPPTRPSEDRIGGRDFARQLRAKMSMMAQRLFQSDSAASQPPVDVGPRHDHHTEIDLAALAAEPPLVAVTEIERVASADPVQITTSPGTWDTQVRERGLPDAGEIVRGVSDTAMILARMFAQSFTGRVGFRKDDVEKVIHFDGGRPVFASSNEPGDRMGELLVREGKITASQYERCQIVVAQSGRRMGEILVDFGYLKRRELLPAVRRHVEDIIYSLFGWDRGHYHVTPDTHASGERIRLSRHTASLVLEGIRRKLDRSTLEKVLGPPSTVIEVADRERLGGILNVGDLAQEERAALSAFDGQADLAQVARTTGVDIADVLPLAWGLCVLGLATARRAEIEHEESTALVGETDLAIDRERVRARWQLVTEADYFALLGVRRDATGFEIRRAYQAALRDFAPDVFPSDLRRELARELEDIASVLDEAFRVLRDDRLRQTYLANLIE